jgi:hypothetical protein
LLHEAGKVVDGLLAVSRVTGTVGDEDTVVVVSDLLDGVVVGKDGNGGTTAGEAAEDVLLDTAVDQSNVVRSTRGLNQEGSLGADTLDKVDLAGIDEALILVGIILVTNGDPGQGRTLLTEVSNDGTGVNARDGRDTLTSAPLAEALDSGPVAVVEGDIGDDNTSALNVRGLKVLEQVELVSLVGGNTVVADQRLGEDEDLATVRRVGHGLWVADEGGGEHSLARDVGIGAESLALEDRTILRDVSSEIRAKISLTIVRTRMVKVAGREATGAVARGVL